MTAHGGIGAAIKRERVRLGWTGADVQRAARVDPTSLSMFERDVRVPRIPVLERLAVAFGVPVTALLGMADAPPGRGSSSLSGARRKSPKRVRAARSAKKRPDIAGGSRARRVS